ncbi:MAG: radical SAM protein [Thermoanaerobaculia bacterium]|nr:radical SAM protein [Thermoanaerobaculia bacterium]
MISVTKLLGGPAFFGDTLRYDASSATQKHGTKTGSGPVVVWNSTKTCNLECIHCYASAKKSKFSGEMTTAEGRAMIDDLASFNVPALLMSGGEPLIRPDILELAEYATSKGIRITFSTNGILIDDAKAKRLKEIGVTYCGISIDGAEPQHDIMRGKKGAFQETLKGIRNCRKHDIRVGLRFTLTSQNMADIDTIFKIVEDEGIGRLCIYHLVYSGRGAYLSGIDVPNEEKRVFMDKLIRQTDKWNKEGREVEVMTVDNHADGPFIYLWLLENDPERAPMALELVMKNGGNRTGVAIGAIDSFGFVHPDQFTQHHTVGNIRERKFSEIWTDPNVPLLAGLRDRKPKLKGRCSTCKWLSCCNGNFRARAEGAFSDYWESDPACYLHESEITNPFEVAEVMA